MINHWFILEKQYLELKPVKILITLNINQWGT